MLTPEAPFEGTSQYPFVNLREKELAIEHEYH
jgi:hypothetical protein